MNACVRFYNQRNQQSAFKSEREQDGVAFIHFLEVDLCYICV